MITLLIGLSIKTGYLMLFMQIDTRYYQKGTHKAAQNQPIFQSYQPFSAYQSIVDRNIFLTNTQADPSQTDTAQKSVSQETALSLDTLKVTELKLTLWGTIVGEGIPSYAIIEDQTTNEQQLYRIGDTVQDSKIKLILRERVILSVNGNDEILSIQNNATGGAGGYSGSPMDSSYSPSSENSSSAGETQPEQVQTVSIPRLQVDESLKNLNDLMQKVRIRPHFENGKANGLILSRVKPDSIFRQLGLETGDVILGVDGQNIESVDDALRFYKSLNASSKVKLQIKRRGNPMTLDFNITE